MSAPTVWHAVIASIDTKDIDSTEVIDWQGYSFNLVHLTAKLKEEMQKISNFWEPMGPNRWEREAGDYNYSVLITEIELIE